MLEVIKNLFIEKTPAHAGNNWKASSCPVRVKTAKGFMEALEAVAQAVPCVDASDLGYVAGIVSNFRLRLDSAIEQGKSPANLEAIEAALAAVSAWTEKRNG